MGYMFDRLSHECDFILLVHAEIILHHSTQLDQMETLCSTFFHRVTIHSTRCRSQSFPNSLYGGMDEDRNLKKSKICA